MTEGDLHLEQDAWPGSDVNKSLLHLVHDADLKRVKNSYFTTINEFT